MHSNKTLKYSAKESSIYLLSRRDHGAFELEQKLIIKGYESKDIEEAISYCIENNYLDDARYAKSQIRQHISKGHGELRIRQELIQKKVQTRIIDEALEVEKVDWFALAKQTAHKKFKQKEAQNRSEYAKQVRFLQYRGFDFEQIKYALSAQSELD